MKKLMTLLTAVLLSWLPMLAAAGTDVISAEDVGQTQTDWTFTGKDTGAQYFFSKAYCWGYGYFQLQSDDYINVTNSVGVVKSITATRFSEQSIGFTVYGAASEISDASTATELGTIDNDNPTLAIEGDYPYVMVMATKASILTEISFTWGDGGSVTPDPEEQCDVPVIELAEPPYTNETVANVYVPEDGIGAYGGTLNVDVQKEGVSVGGDFPVATQNANYQFNLPGQPDESLEIVAWVSHEGFIDSDKVTKPYTIEAAVVPTPGETVVDEITYEDVAENHTDWTFTGKTSGAEYFFDNVRCNPASAQYFYLNKGNYINVTKSPGVIREISVTEVLTIDKPDFTVYGSTSEITDISNATYLGVITKNDKTLKITEGNYTYVRLVANANSSKAKTMSFTWEKSGSVEPPVDNWDHITGANLQAQNPDADFNGSAYNTLTYKGQKAEYKLDNANSNGSWWSISYPGYLYSTTSGGYIKSVKFELLNESTEEVSFYASNDPIDVAQPWTGTKTIYINKTDGVFEWTADDIYRYIYYCDSKQVNDLAIEWTDVAPEPTCATPEINCYVDKIVPGTEVNIYVSTNETGVEGGTLHYDLKKQGETTSLEGYPKETSENYASVILQGNPNDVLVVSAWVSHEGYKDSKVASKSFTLERGKVRTPSISQYQDVVAGQVLTLQTTTEGATLDYTYGLKNGETEVGTPVSVTAAASPVTITVPADAEVGMTFYVTAVAKCENFDDSDPYNNSWSVMSDVLEAPTFSIESGTVVEAGTVVKITRPANASTIHYTVNGGEEQSVRDWQTSVAITEDMEIVAWATGDAPFKQSPNATATYTVEKFGENIDVILPNEFSGYVENATNYTEGHTLSLTNNDYVYNGGFYPQYGKPSFYCMSSSNPCIIYNTKGEKKIIRIKIDCQGDYADIYGKFASDAAITAVEDGAQLNIMGPKHDWVVAGQATGDWITLATATVENGTEMPTDPKYFAFWFDNSNTFVSRILVEYENNTGTGIDGIAAEGNGEEMIFDLNGAKVKSLENAVPGVYVRVVNGKATKVMVK